MRLSLALLVMLPVSAGSQAARPNANQLQADAERAQASNDLPAAERDYQQLVQLHPKAAELHAAYGGVLALEEKYDAAITELKAALAGSGKKQQPAVLFALGKAYAAKGDYREAREWLQVALGMQPGNIPVVVLLGDCDLKLHEPKAAVAVMAPRQTLSTRDIPFMDVYGRALIETGKLSEGAEMLEHVAEANNDPATYLLAGTTFLKNDEYASARRNLEFARKADATLPGLDLPLAVARERSGDTFAAEAVFRDELKANPDDFSANLYLGTLLYRHHKTAEAGPYLEHALALKPTDATAQCEEAALRSGGSCSMMTMP